jgi:hypothetical protein
VYSGVLCDLTDDERNPVEGAGPERHLRLQGEEGLQREGGVVQVGEGGEGEGGGRREDDICRFGSEAGQDGDVICYVAAQLLRCSCGRM